MNPHFMKKVVGRYESVKRARLEGYRIVFDTYSSSWRGGIAGIREDPKGVVYGAVYLLTEDALELLDRYEGVPSQRLRLRVEVEVEGERLGCITHVSARPRGNVIPSREYVAEMIRGLKLVGYDEDVIRIVESYVKTLERP